MQSKRVPVGSHSQGVHLTTPPPHTHREDLQAFNANLTAEEGVPSIGDGQLDFSLRLFDLNQVTKTGD